MLLRFSAWIGLVFVKKLLEILFFRVQGVLTEMQFLVLNNHLK